MIMEILSKNFFWKLDLRPSKKWRQKSCPILLKEKASNGCLNYIFQRVVLGRHKTLLMKGFERMEQRDAINRPYVFGFTRGNEHCNIIVSLTEVKDNRIDTSKLSLENGLFLTNSVYVSFTQKILILHHV